MERIETGGGVMAEQSFAEGLRESRVFYRRRLAARLAVEMLRRPVGGKNEFVNPAAYVEDFANAVTERLAAREDQELDKA